MEKLVEFIFWIAVGCFGACGFWGFAQKISFGPIFCSVKGGGKVGQVGGSIVGLRRWKTVSSAPFYSRIVQVGGLITKTVIVDGANQ